MKVSSPLPHVLHYEALELAQVQGTHTKPGTVWSFPPLSIFPSSDTLPFPHFYLALGLGTRGLSPGDLQAPPKLGWADSAATMSDSSWGQEEDRLVSLKVETLPLPCLQRKRPSRAAVLNLPTAKTL